jgi:hypothetical protein
MGIFLDLFGTITSIWTEHIRLSDTFWFKGRNVDGGGYDDYDEDEASNNNNHNYF